MTITPFHPSQITIDVESFHPEYHIAIQSKLGYHHVRPFYINLTNTSSTNLETTKLYFVRKMTTYHSMGSGIHRRDPLLRFVSEFYLSKITLQPLNAGQSRKSIIRFPPNQQLDLSGSPIRGKVLGQRDLAPDLTLVIADDIYPYFLGVRTQDGRHFEEQLMRKLPFTGPNMRHIENSEDNPSGVTTEVSEIKKIFRAIASCFEDKFRRDRYAEKPTRPLGIPTTPFVPTSGPQE